MGLGQQIASFFGFQRDATSSGQQIADRSRRRISRGAVSLSQAQKHSVVWACQVLRADLISTLPADGFKPFQGIDMGIKLPQFFAKANDEIDFSEWMYDTQIDLDSTGNTFGLITKRDGNGLIGAVELLPQDELRILVRGSKIVEVHAGGDKLRLEDIWHERQFTRSGMPVGLSPIAHAAHSLNAYLSAQEFAASWFAAGGVPIAHLKNTGKVLNPDESAKIKERFLASIQSSDIFVSGMDWTYSPLSAKASETQFIEAMQATGPELCRFLGVPADMVDVAPGGGATSITYANVTQRNLQLLTMHLGPAIRRRERRLSDGMLPPQRFVKLNRGALLEMDLAGRYEAHEVAIRARFKAPSEIRALENLPPFTADQLAEFAVLFPNKPAINAPTTGA